MDKRKTNFKEGLFYPLYKDEDKAFFAILQETKSGSIDLQKLNNILELWDFTELFANY